MCHFAKTAATTKSFPCVTFRTKSQLAPSCFSYLLFHSVPTLTGVQTCWVYYSILLKYVLQFLTSLPWLMLLCVLSSHASISPSIKIPLYTLRPTSMQLCYEILLDTQSHMSPRVPSVFTVTAEMAALLVPEDKQFEDSDHGLFFFFCLHCLTNSLSSVSVCFSWRDNAVIHVLILHSHTDCLLAVYYRIWAEREIKWLGFKILFGLILSNFRTLCIFRVRILFPVEGISKQFNRKGCIWTSKWKLQTHSSSLIEN